MTLCQVANVGGVSLEDNPQFHRLWADARYEYPYRGLNGEPSGEDTARPKACFPRRLQRGVPTEVLLKRDPAMLQTLDREGSRREKVMIAP